MTKDAIPKFDALMGPTVAALKALGGSASNEELHDWIADHLKVSSSARDELHADTSMTELRYRLHWARSYLKAFGAINNSERGVWTLTEAGEKVTDADVPLIKKAFRERLAKRKAAREDTPDDEADGPISWTEQLLGTLKAMRADAFERLCQRLLRESGFIKVEVTGRAGDGGIDGIGVLRVNLVSFHVLFQSKRWKDTVGPGVVRDFRGAMVGRADKGLIITTGAFTVEARREATRDGAPAIDLIDGEALCSLLKDIKLGVRVRLVEEIEIDPAFYDAI
jgi:restriction system protein